MAPSPGVQSIGKNQASDQSDVSDIGIGWLESDLEFVMAQRMTAGKLWEVVTNYESGR